MNRIDIHIVDLTIPASCEARNVLSDHDRERAAQFRFDIDRERWVAARVALRMALARPCGLDAGEVPLIISADGKPVLESPFQYIEFNLSHCQDLAVIAITRNWPIGIDIEPRQRDVELLGCETGFCHPMEIAALPEDPKLRAAALLQIWTSKEAVLKAAGCGLGFPPETLRIAVGGGPALAVSEPQEFENQRIYPLGHPALDRYRCAVATACPAPEFAFVSVPRAVTA